VEAVAPSQSSPNFAKVFNSTNLCDVMLFLALFLFLVWNFSEIKRRVTISLDEPTKWIPLPTWFLQNASKAIAFVFPHKIICEEEEPLPSSTLFVCNHQLGAFEIPLLYALIYLQTGLYPRGLADRFHFYVPIYRNVLWMIGGILGDREVCRKVMQARQPLLVFPGGGDEVMRRGDLKYTLLWGNRKGFAQLAIENKYTIVPVTSIGAEDMFYTVVNIPLKFIFKLFNDKRASESKFVYPLQIPNFQFQKQYFRFGKRLDTSELQLSEETITLVRDQTKQQVQDGFLIAKRTRAEDPQRFLTWRYLLGERL
jgi:1-acyl-sn-glycerol-3-phosphate acyltransferase